MYLAGVVDEMFTQLLAAPTVDGGMLGGAVVGSARERHLAIFSDDPAVQGLFEAAGIDGALQPGDPGQVEVVVQNFGANKLDLFTETSYEVTLEPNDCTMIGADLDHHHQRRTPRCRPTPLPVADRRRPLVGQRLPASQRHGPGDPRGRRGDHGQRADRTGPSGGCDAGGHPGRAMRPRSRSAGKKNWPSPTYQLALQPQPLVNPATLTVSGIPDSAVHSQRHFRDPDRAVPPTRTASRQSPLGGAAMTGLQSTDIATTGFELGGTSGPLEGTCRASGQN